MYHNFLQEILPSIKDRVEKINRNMTLIRKPHLFSGEGIIAEIKFASPSTRVLSVQNNYIEIARNYLNAGASAISVLTEPYYFKGSLEHLKEIRQAFPKAILLRKDFIIDEAQLYETVFYGADIVLLIVALLKPEQLLLLHNQSIALGLTTLVEVHTIKELEIALQIGAKIIGVNNRDLISLKTNLGISKELIKYTPKDITLISESGIKNAQDIILLQAIGYKGFLIGNSLMKTENPGQALKALLSEVKNAY